MGVSNTPKGIEVLDIVAPFIGDDAVRSYYEKFMSGARPLRAVRADSRSRAQ